MKKLTLTLAVLAISAIASADVLQEGKLYQLTRPLEVQNNEYKSTSDPEFCVVKAPWLKGAEAGFQLGKDTVVRIQRRNRVEFFLSGDSVSEFGFVSVTCYDQRIALWPTYIEFGEISEERASDLLGLKRVE